MPGPMLVLRHVEPESHILYSRVTGMGLGAFAAITWALFLNGLDMVWYDYPLYTAGALIFFRSMAANMNGIMIDDQVEKVAVAGYYKWYWRVYLAGTALSLLSPAYWWYKAYTLYATS